MPRAERATVLMEYIAYILIVVGLVFLFGNLDRAVAVP